MSDDEYNRLLDEFPRRLELHLTWTKYCERLIQAGRRTGRTDLEIGDDIRDRYRGQLPEITIRKALPSSMKHQEFSNKADNQATIGDKKYRLPPPLQVVREAETQTDYTVTVTEKEPTPKSPDYYEDTIITIKDKRFSFLELDRARQFAQSCGDSFITIGVRNNEIKIL